MGEVVVQAAQEALTALYAAVSRDVADDVRAKVQAVIQSHDQLCEEKKAWEEIQGEIKEALLWNGLKLVVREDGRWVVRSVGVTPGANDLIEARESLAERAPVEAPDAEGERCDDCGRVYQHAYRIPDSLWKLIHPRAPAGLLCLQCCDQRLRERDFIPFWECPRKTTIWPTDDLMDRLSKMVSEALHGTGEAG